MAGWIKALGMSSVPMLSSWCLCLTGCFASLPWLSAAGKGMRRTGRKAKTPSVRAWFGVLCLCPGKAQFVHGVSCCWKLRKPKHEWDQKELHKLMVGGS